MDHFASVSCGIAASIGVTSHVLYFVRGEHHQHALQFLQIIFYGFFPWSLILSLLLQIQYAQAMKLGALLFGSYLTGLWLSMLVYRSLFHPLHSFPGPRLAPLSKFYQFFTGFRLDAYRRSHKAHQKYGNFVRTGRSSCCGFSEIRVFPLAPLHKKLKQASLRQRHSVISLPISRPRMLVKSGFLVQDLVVLDGSA